MTDAGERREPPRNSITCGYLVDELVSPVEKRLRQVLSGIDTPVDDQAHNADSLAYLSRQSSDPHPPSDMPQIRQLSLLRPDRLLHQVALYSTTAAPSHIRCGSASQGTKAEKGDQDALKAVDEYFANPAAKDRSGNNFPTFCG